MKSAHATLALSAAIAYRGNTQKDVAHVYAWAMTQDDCDWQRVNREIIERWSVAGLTRIKRMAWERPS